MKQLYTKKIFDNRLYRDPLSRLAHWLFVAALALDYLYGNQLSHAYGGWFWVILLLGALYNIVPFIYKRAEFLMYDIPALLYHFTLIGALVVFFIPPGNIFNWITLALLATSIYWVGLTGFILGGAAIALMFVGSAWALAGFSGDTPYILLLEIILLYAFGGLLYRLTAADRRERRQLIEFSEEAAFERERLRSLINSMADAVIATNSKGIIQLYNGAALDVLNTNVSVEGKHLDEVLNLRDEQNNSVSITKLAEKTAGVIKRDDLHFADRDKSEVDLYLSVAPIYKSSENGEGGLICIFRDITRQKSLDEQRDEFVSIASHELRTPIAITEANISTALLPALGKLGKQRKALLEQAHQNTLFLADLVNDLTTLARAERGDLELESEEVDVVSLAEKLVREYQRQAEDRGLKLSLKAPSKPLVISSNHYRVHEILQNFLTNALKYTREGEIVVRVRADKKRGGVVCAVKDSGIGISNSDQKHIFAKFWRSEDYRTQEHSGTGLGLYITKKLAERLGGEVWFKSVLNEGTTFYVWLPQELDAEERKTDSNQEPKA